MDYMTQKLSDEPCRKSETRPFMDTPSIKLPMRTLLLCNDVQFLGTTRNVLSRLQVTPETVGNGQQALNDLAEKEFEVIVVDWREIDNLGEFLSAIRRSKRNHESVLIAIVRDLLDLRQAFASGVHFLIHKPASMLQIERCMRAAYGATVVRRRKHHRETVKIPAIASTRDYPYAEVTIVNLSEGGAGIRLHRAGLENDTRTAFHVRVAEDIDLQFTLPATGPTIHSSGRVIWSAADTAGIRFISIPESDRFLFENWLTECVERSLTEVQQRLRGVCA
jgi:CheY-like chemotaxis protein